MYYGGGGGDTANNRHPSFARHNGKEAVREALQHHVDRLQPNKTKADYSRPIYHGPLESMQPASKGAIARARAINAAHPNKTFFTPAQAKAADNYARHNAPLNWLGNKAENFLQLKQVGQQAVQMFDPRSRQGLANIAETFAGGGPEGLGEEGAGMGGRMPPGMEPYDLMKASASGKFKFGRAQNIPSTRDPMASRGDIISAIRHAQGVGGYKGTAGEGLLQKIEMDRARQVEHNRYVDENKQIDNQLGASDMKAKYLQKNGMEPYSTFNHDVKGEGLHYKDTQPFDFTDRLKAINAYKDPRVQEAFGGNPEAFKQALYDMLFGGKGLLRTPRRPGSGGSDSPYGSPYGGGPFG